MTRKARIAAAARRIRLPVPIRALRLALMGALVAALAACVTVPPVQQAFARGADGAIVGRPLACADGKAIDAVRPLPGPTLRVLSWNLHKNDDPGWDTDLAHFAAASDVLLIQEASLTPALLAMLREAGYDWLLAGAFRLNGVETGVLVAARVQPAQACVQRYVEPLLGLPKAAVVARYRMAGVDGTLAVANVHAVNFTLGVDDYRAQLEAIAHELAGHRGPMLVAGDLNVWSAARRAVVDDVMGSLGLTPVVPALDTRSRFFGQQVDYVFVRGLDVVRAQAPEVESSDHNPVLATLRVRASGP